MIASVPNVPVDSSLNITFRNVESDIQISNIPTISGTTADVLKQLNVEDLPLVITEKYSLVDKAKTLFDLTSKLENARDYYTKRKLFCFLKSLAMISLLAITILTIPIMISVLGEVGAALSVFICLFFIVAYAASAFYSADQAGIRFHPGNKAAILIGLLVGPFFPIYEAFGKMPSLRKELRQQIGLAKPEFEAKFNEFITFFEKDLTKYREELNQKITQCEETLTAISSHPIRTSAGEQEIQTKRERFATALNELERALEFVKEFQSNTVESLEE